MLINTQTTYISALFTHVSCHPFPVGDVMVSLFYIRAHTPSGVTKRVLVMLPQALVYCGRTDYDFSAEISLDLTHMI